MPGFEKKTVITSYKLRIQNKFKGVLEETENVITLLRSCVSSFRDKVSELLDNNDENFFSLYEKLNNDFEKYQDKLFLILASVEHPVVDDTDKQIPQEENRPCISSNNLQQFCLPSFSQAASVQSHLNSVLPSRASSVSSASFCSLQNVCGSSTHITLKDSCTETVDRSSPIVTNRNLVNYESELIQPSSENDLPSSENDLPSSENDLPSPELQQSSKNPQESSQSSCYRTCSSIISVFKVSSASSNLTGSLNLQTAQGSKPQCSENNIIHQTSTHIRPSPLILPSSISIPSVVSATLTHIINPDDFWMQLENSKEYVLTFPSSQDLDLIPPSRIQNGIFCLAPFKSIPCFYRGKVMSDVSEDLEVEVLYIDHGSTQCISISNLRLLPEKLYKIPMQAVHCCLSDISPINGAWTQPSIDKLREFQNNTLETHVKALKYNTNGYKYAVQLIAAISAVFSEDFSCDIAQALCLDGLATMDEVSPNVQESTSSEISNQASCDSGVSVTSSQQASPGAQALSVSSDMLVNWNLSSEPFNALQKKTYPDLGAIPKTASNKCTIDVIPDLISFDSAEGMCGVNTENKSGLTIESVDLVGKCSRTIDCKCELHLEIPPPLVMFVEKDMMLVMLSHIVNPNEFYVNLAMDDSFTLDELRDQMSSVYESSTQKFHPIVFHDLKEGMYLAGRYLQDGNWYRVRVARINSESARTCDVYVQYIDYGNKAFIKCCDLRPLLQQFAEHPAFSIKCSLAGVTPKNQGICHSGDSNFGSESWSGQAVEKFRELASFERCLTAQICEPRLVGVVPSLVSTSFESKPLQVLLWDTEGTEDVLINEAFSESNLADFHNNILKIIEQNAEQERREAEVLNQWDPMHEEFEDIENSYGVCKEDPTVALSGYRPNDETYTCKYFSLRGWCPRGVNCQYDHIPLAAGGVTRDQEKTFAMDPTPQLPSSSDFVLIQITAVINPGHFYCMLPFGSTPVDEVDSLVNRGAVNKVWVKDEIKALFQDIGEYYSTAPFSENTTVALSYGTIVIAWRRADSCWHRGRVLDVSDVSGPAKVFFVDFGHSEWVPRKKIRRILPQYLHTPFQAIECHLSDVEALGAEHEHTWSHQAMCRFKELVSCEILLAHITYRCGKVLHLTVMKTNQNDRRDISRVLVDEGFAQWLLPVPTSPKKESIYVPG